MAMPRKAEKNMKCSKCKHLIFKGDNYVQVDLGAQMKPLHQCISCYVEVLDQIRVWALYDITRVN